MMGGGETGNGLNRVVCDNQRVLRKLWRRERRLALSQAFNGIKIVYGWCSDAHEFVSEYMSS